MNLLWGCDAPRVNPLDPENPDYNYILVRGRTVSNYATIVGIDDVIIKCLETERTTTSSGGGYFAIEVPKDTLVQLITIKEGYHTDTLSFSGGESVIENAEFNMNRLPVLEDVSFYSIVIQRDRTPVEFIYRLEVNARITDLDIASGVDDIKAVKMFLEGRENNYIQLLYDSETTGYYSPIGISELSKFNLSTLEDLVGPRFDISVVDKDSVDIYVGSTRLIRIIDSPFENLLPEPDVNIITPEITFEWERFSESNNYDFCLYFYDYATEELIDSIIQRNNPNRIIYNNEDNKLIRGEFYNWKLVLKDDYGNQMSTVNRRFLYDAEAE